MTSTTFATQQKVFAKRMKRIESGRNRRWKDPNTGFTVTKKAGAKKSMPSPPSFVRSVIVGVAVLLIARYALFQAEIYAPEDVLAYAAGYMPIIVVAFPLFLLLTVRMMFGRRGFLSLLMQAGTVILGAAALHNAVWLAPDVFLQVFSPEWVSSVKASAEPGTLVLGSLTYRL
ncbi:hypothetical protein AAD018_007475 [Aestuariibius insulae]|uniref:hypothetical protein n=1 Tax=Aestuariibius insulae TaxID=2058287 RepID=UPI00345E13D4